MFTKIEEGLKAYGKALDEYAKEQKAVKFNYTDRANPESLSWNHRQELSTSIARLEGMRLALGLSYKEAEAFHDQAGVVPLVKLFPGKISASKKNFNRFCSD